MADSLGDRMKANYEDAYRITLPKRMPLIIRVDGKAFHGVTKNCDRPFDEWLMSRMNFVAEALMAEVQGAQLAFTQSDEISVLVHNYKKLDSQAWFDNNLQKIVSVSAAIATREFNEQRGTARELPAVEFDSRAFVLPEAEVCNYFIWRQNDAVRNSIQMVAQSLYSHNELLGKNQSEQQEMIFQKGTNWNNLRSTLKRGRVTFKALTMIGSTLGKEIITLAETPDFKTDRNFVEQFLRCENDTD